MTSFSHRITLSMGVLSLFLVSSLATAPTQAEAATARSRPLTVSDIAQRGISGRTTVRGTVSTRLENMAEIRDMYIRPSDVNRKPSGRVVRLPFERRSVRELKSEQIVWRRNVVDSRSTASTPAEVEEGMNP